MQGYSKPNALRQLLISLMLGLIPMIPVVAEEQNVAVLIDRSLSVEPTNRDDALKLISGILTNTVPSHLAQKWHFIPETGKLQNPTTREYRTRLQNDLKQALSNQVGAFSIPQPTLLLGSIGNLDTVLALRKAKWVQQAPMSIVRFGTAHGKGDAETHFELGRAIVASRLAAKSEYILFVVSDGVEDLYNQTVSFYLDSKKLASPRALNRGDFLNQTNLVFLNKKNNERKSGKELRKSGGRKSPGYDMTERQFLKAYREDFDELLIGRFALHTEELRDFFANHTNKVPVFVSVYRNSPRIGLEARFTHPLTTSQKDPYALTSGDSTVNWEIKTSNARLNELTLKLEKLPDNTLVKAWNLDLEKRSLDLLKEIPGLNGSYLLTLQATAGELKVPATCYLDYQKSITPRPRPVITGTSFSKASVENPVDLEELAGSAFTEEEIRWTWLLEDIPSKDRPKKLAYVLQAWDRTRQIPDNDFPTSKGSLSPRKTSLPISALIDSPDEDEFFFFGETCRFTLTGSWSDGTKHRVSTFLTFPEPQLRILGRSDQQENEDHPRIVRTDDRIKISNWMHPKDDRTMRYHLGVQRWDDGAWKDWTENEVPLEVVHKKTGAYIRVAKAFKGKLRYTLELLYDKGQHEDGGIPLVDAEGYVKYADRPWLPYLVIAFGVAAVGLFAWNLLARRS